MEASVESRTSTSASSDRGIPGPLRYGGLAVLGVLIVCVVLLAGLRVIRSGALPGVTVGDVEVGGLADEALHDAIAGAGAHDETIAVVHGDERVEATGADIGYTLDVEATETAVMRRGRQWNPVAALADHLRAFSSAPIEVALVHEVDEAPLAAWVSDAARTLSTGPVEGAVAFVGTDIERTDPRAGVTVRVDDLLTDVHDALLDGSPREIEAPADLTEPATTVEEVDRVVALAQRALSAPVTLTRGEGRLVIEPDELATMLRVRPDGGELRLEVNPLQLSTFVDGDLREAFETAPVDARFEVAGGAVHVVPSADGFRFDPEMAAEQVGEIATGEGPREAELAGETTEPDFTTDEAEGLGIVEQVSSFTTTFQCCQSRVTNIHRIAELVSGVVIKPGETFSVNGHVGQRTRANGFVEGGAIQQGEFVSEVGGGVSQFATTMYNAAYFGGYEIPDFKAHSYYISRYPVGREATLNYPDVDLKVRNNSPNGILVQTSYTGTSVTVAFWGTQWVEVDSIAGGRHGFRAPPLQVRENPGMPAGAERVVQSGREGFDVTVTRVLRFPDGREEREDVFTRYLAEPRIVERGTAEPPDEDPPPEGEDDGPPPEDAERDGDGDANGEPNGEPTGEPTGDGD